MKAGTTETQSYRLAWKSKRTGATGNGSPTSREIVDLLVRAMNEQFPDLEHWAEPVDAGENEKGASGR